MPDPDARMPPTPQTPQEAAEVAGYVPAPGDMVVVGRRAWTVTEDGWVDLGEVESVSISVSDPEAADRLIYRMRRTSAASDPVPASIRQRLQAVEDTLDEAATWEYNWERFAHRWTPPPEDSPPDDSDF
jgi:hypothetical protein